MNLSFPKIKQFFFDYGILVLILFAVLLRIWWLNAPIERDEGHFGYEGWLITQGDYPEYSIDNKLIGLYLYYAIPISFHNSIYSVRLFTNTLYLISLYFLYRLFCKLFDKQISLHLLLFYIMATNVPMLEGYLVMAESISLIFLVFLISALHNYLSTRRVIYLFFHIVSTGIFLTLKQHNWILFVAYPFIFLFLWKKLNLENTTFKKKFLVGYLLLVGFLGVIFYSLFFEQVFYFFNFLQYSFQFDISYVPFFHFFLAIVQVFFILIYLVYAIIFTFKSRRIITVYSFILFLIFSLASFIPKGFSHQYQYMIIPSLFLIGSYFKQIPKKIPNWYIVSFFLLIFGVFLFLQSPDYSVRLPFFEYYFQDTPSLEKQMDISEQLFLYNESTVYLLNWEPAIAWLGEKRIVNFLPLGNCDAVDSVVLRNQLVVIYPYYINKCNLNLDKIKRENKIIIK